MKLLGITVPFTGTRQKALAPLSERRGGWFAIIRESFPGAWQQNVEVNAESVMSYHAVYACMTLIASDIAKLGLRLITLDPANGIWVETENPAFSPVLRKPNPIQTRIQFIETWILSKLSRGNTLVLKSRDGRGVVTGLRVLDWTMVTPLISDSGEVFYELNADNVAGIREKVVVPAREVIHDRFNCIFHPLIGTSPIVACGLSATQGLRIQNNSAKFFENGSTPPGMLTAPGAISDETATRLKEHWETNYTGDNAGKVAVLGDGLEYKAMAVNAVDSQLIEQLKWTVEIVCSTFHVPPYKIGIGTFPVGLNVQALNIEYYSQCLQILIEALELCLDEGLALPPTIGIEADVDNLLRMDSVTQMDVLDKGKNIYKPDEARKKLNLPPVAGGDAVYRQQQDFSLAALAKRDAQDDPFGKSAPAPGSDAAQNDEQATAAEAGKALAFVMKELA